MKRIKPIAIILLLSTLVLWSCPEEVMESGRTTSPQEEDPYQAFKADASSRFEGAGKATVKISDATYLFCSDKGGLFSSTKNKLGYASRNGTTYYIIEWSGDTSVGNKSGASLRTETAVVSLHSLQVIKSQGGVVWVVYRQTATSAEGKVVYKM